MKIKFFVLLFACFVCVNTQSSDNGGSCNGPPTCQCNCGVQDSSTPSVTPNQNVQQGRPGKVGAPGQPGSIGQKGQKGEQGTPEDVSEELKEVKKQLKKLIDWQIQSSKNCYELYNMGFTTSGVYNITVQRRKTTVYCDMDTDGGGWTVIQRRSNNETDFFRGWNDYKEGFGSKTDDFWQGLDSIYGITKTDDYLLRVDIEDFENNTAYALYNSFEIGNEAAKYKLSVSGYNGTAGDSLAYHNNQLFTTKDQDNDSHKSANCAASYFGGWWYKMCHYSNLNGKYLGEEISSSGMVWYHWKNQHYSLKRSEMKIRPK